MPGRVFALVRDGADRDSAVPGTPRTITPGRAVTPLFLAALLALHGATRAQSTGGPFAVPSQTIARGGGHSTGGAFELDGTVAQHAIGAPASGGDYLLIPGFRRQRELRADALFSDDFESP
jgi:hypothetical protein